MYTPLVPVKAKRSTTHTSCVATLKSDTAKQFLDNWQVEYQDNLAIHISKIGKDLCSSFHLKVI
jgi:hypothetical protein